jgi:hypothetical protein
MANNTTTIVEESFDPSGPLFSTRQSPPTTDSIGTRIVKYGLWTCWSILPESPVHVVLSNRVQEKIIIALADNLSKGEKFPVDGWACEFWMVGKNESKALPTVVFCHPTQWKLRKKAREIIRKEIKRLELPNVFVRSLNRGCPQLATSPHDGLVEDLPPGTVMLQRTTNPTYGCRIYTCYGQPNLNRSATLGGFLFAGGKLYGFTVSHAFHAEINVPPATEEELFDSENEDSITEESAGNGNFSISIYAQILIAI